MDKELTRYDSEAVILAYDRPPTRVVSLVPSMTETFFDMGIGQMLVGVTDFCKPPETAGELVRVGGSKSPDIDAILGLDPELVIVNQEETSKAAVEALEQAGMKVWLTFPRSTLDALDLLWTVVKLFRLGDQAKSVETLARTLDWTEKATTGRLAIPTFVPIWQDEKESVGPWFMTFNYQTYAHDVLAKCGGMNVFAGRVRRYPLDADLGLADFEDPGERDTRYPRITVEEIVQAEPEIILLPSEPFEFEAGHQAQIEDLLAETPAVSAGRVHLVDGSLLTWHGTRLAKALAELPSYLRL